jgi:hypothetical protein
MSVRLATPDFEKSRFFTAAVQIAGGLIDMMVVAERGARP